MADTNGYQGKYELLRKPADAEIQNRDANNKYTRRKRKLNKLHELKNNRDWNKCDNAGDD